MEWFKNFFTINKKDHQDTKYLTGIRAYAALGVFAVHYGIYLSINGFVKKLVDFGKYGVIVFFILSSFTILFSLGNKGDFNFKSYIAKRIFRIVPLYYLLITIGFLLGGVSYYLNLFEVRNSLSGLFLHYSFLNLLDPRYMNTLLGVEWTIPIEVFFYFLIPIAFFYIKKKPKRIFQLLLITFAISYVSELVVPSIITPEVAVIYNQFSVLRYFFTYGLGISSYLLWIKLKDKFAASSLELGLLLFTLPIYILVGFPVNSSFVNITFVSLWATLLILFSSSRNKLSRIIFENRFAVFMGNISYSFYLVHFIFIAHDSLLQDFSPLKKILIGFLLTLIISTITYLFIEKPFISFGKKIAARFS